MKVKEFAEVCKSELRIKSAYNDKILCYRYDKEKHAETIGEREVKAIWSDTQIIKGVGFCDWVKAIICVYVNGHIEWEKEQKKGQ